MDLLCEYMILFINMNRQSIIISSSCFHTKYKSEILPPLCYHIDHRTKSRPNVTCVNWLLFNQILLTACVCCCNRKAVFLFSQLGWTTGLSPSLAIRDGSTVLFFYRANAWVAVGFKVQIKKVIYHKVRVRIPSICLVFQTGSIRHAMGLSKIVNRHAARLFYLFVQ